MKPSILSIFLLLFSCCCIGQTYQSQTPVTDAVNGNIGGYYESLPVDYAANPAQKYPLLIFIHGNGELGQGTQTDLPKLLLSGTPPHMIHNKQFPAQFTVNGTSHSFIVISPQMKKDSSNYPHIINSLIDYCIKKYRVDEKRIYLTGLSMGGGFSWMYASGDSSNAQRLAAMLVVCGHRNSSTTRANNLAAADLPIWMTHNIGDSTVPFYYTRNWFNDLNKTAISPKPLIDSFNANYHNAWGRTYGLGFSHDGPDTLNVYEWMLQYSRSTYPPKAQAGVDQTITLPLNKVTLNGSGTDSDGSIATYKWSRVSGIGYDLPSPGTAGTTITGLATGEYVFRLTVTDNQGASGSDDVRIRVLDSATNVRYLRVNLHGGTRFGHPMWNDWNIGSGDSTNLLSGLWKYADGDTATITGVLSQSATRFDNGTAYPTEMAPSAVVRFGSSSTQARTLTLKGLSPGRRYHLELYASRKETAGHATVFGVNGATETVSTSNNAKQKVLFKNLAPTTGGQLVVSISGTAGTNYLNGFTLLEDTATVVPNEPLTVNAGNDTTIVLRPNEVLLNGRSTGTVAAFKWTRVAGLGGTFADDSSAVTKVTGLATGSYTFRLTATGTAGQTATDDVKITVVDSALNTLRYIKVSMQRRNTTYAHPEWNLWYAGESDTTNVTSGGWKYADGIASGVYGTLSQTSGTGENYADYPGEMAPPGVLRYSSFSTVARTLTIRGLVPSKKYHVELYASSRSYSGNTTVFTVDNRSDSIVTFSNYGRAALFTNLSPNAAGALTVDIRNLNRYNFLNGFTIMEVTGSGTNPAIQVSRDAVQSSAPARSLSVAPNPVRDQLALRLNNRSRGALLVQLVDMNGNVRKEYRFTKEADHFYRLLPLSGLQAGEYIIRTQVGPHVETAKVMKL